MMLETIREASDILSRAEKRVAQAVLDAPHQAVTGNISELARVAEVSEPTVVRFCRALGYDGWQAFKLSLAQNLALSAHGSHLPLSPNDLADDLVNKICTRSVNTLLRLRAGLQAEVVHASLDALEGAHKIEIYGQGTSGFVAQDAQHKFFRSGVHTVAYTDPSVHSIAAALLEREDVAILISQRGDNPGILKSARLAQKNNATRIVLAPAHSPLAELGSICLPIDPPQDPAFYTPISGRLAHLVALDILAVGLALRRDPAFHQKMHDAQRLLETLDVHFDSLLGF